MLVCFIASTLHSCSVVYRVTAGQSWWMVPGPSESKLARTCPGVHGLIPTKEMHATIGSTSCPTFSLPLLLSPLRLSVRTYWISSHVNNLCIMKTTSEQTSPLYIAKRLCTQTQTRTISKQQEIQDSIFRIAVLDAQSFRNITQTLCIIISLLWTRSSLESWYNFVDFSNKKKTDLCRKI